MEQLQLGKRGLWVMTATILGSSLAWLNSSALNVALNAIQEDLGASATELLWIVNIYLLLLASFILISGSLGDRFGRNRIFGLGVIVFTVGSIASGLAPSTLFLIGARAVQGLGGALMVPGSLAIITATIQESDRGQAIGIWSAASAITTLLGPPLGGFLAESDLWRAIFFIPLPLAIVIIYALTKVPETKDENAAEQLDYLGAVVLALSLGAITFGALQLGEVTSLNTRALIAIAAIVLGVVLMVAYIIIERRSDHPMLDLSLFKSKTFSGTNTMTAFLYAGLAAALVFFPLNLIQVQGYGETIAGLASLPISVLLAVMSPVMGRVLHRVGPRLLLTVGPAIAGLGFALLALPGITEGPSEYWTTFLPGMVVLGLGMGITVAPLTTTVMSAAPSQKSGQASGINNAITRTAQALATGLLGAVMIFAFTTSLLNRAESLDIPQEAQQTLQNEAADLGNAQVPEQLPQETQDEVNQAIDRAFVDGFRLVMGIAAALAAISAVMSLLLIRPDVLEEDDEAREGEGASQQTEDQQQPASA